MCLHVALDRPDDVLAKGTHAGLDWMVVHNGMGYRCGYVRVPPGHPWHGLSYNDAPALVHGGLTFAAPDRPCSAGGDDGGWWVGFDCAHSDDAPDPALPQTPRSGLSARLLALFGDGRGNEVRDQQYVEAECRSLCEQAAKVVGTSPLVVGGDA